jgi:hypothetical protein
MDAIVPLFIVVPIAVIVLQLCLRIVPREERDQVTRILYGAFALRLLAALMFSLIPETRVFHEDANGYEGIGMAIASAWKGQGPPLTLPSSHNLGYYYVCAAIYYVFGAYRAAPSFFNALLGTLTVFFVYRMARRFFHPLVARRAATCAAFFPSMILWSSMALKDTPVTLLIVITLISCMELKRRFSIPAALGTMLPVIAVQPIRFYIIYFLGLAVVGSLVFERGAKAFTGVPKQILIAGGVVALLAVVGFASSAQSGVDMLSFEKVHAFRQGMATTADSGFASEVDISTPGGALAFLPLGLATLLLAPFPWQLTSFRSALTAPEMLIWWMLIPSLIRGVRHVVRHRFAECSPILLFAVTLTAAYSLVHGNVGSGFRQRAQIFVFLFIFSALGQYLKLCRQRGVDEKVLMNPPGKPQ